MIKVLITDDHPIVRKGLMQILEDDHRIGLIEEACDGKEMLEKLLAQDFDVVLLDISLPGKSGLEMLVEAKKIKPKIAFLILSIHPEEQYAIRALKLGASGYLTKSSATEELIDAVIRISEGEIYITSNLVQKIAMDLIDKGEKPVNAELSIREREVISFMAQGKTLSSIAKELSLSPKTISTYRERILTKLNLKTTSDIIRYAIKERL